MKRLPKLIPLALLLIASSARTDMLLEPLPAQSTPKSSTASSSNPAGLSIFDKLGVPGSSGVGVCRAPKEQNTPGANLVDPDAPAGPIGDGGLPDATAFKRVKDAPVLNNQDKKLMDLIAKSPTLQNELQKLKAANWKFVYTDLNSRTSRRETPYGKEKTIYINNEMNAVGTIQELTHEVGHALHTPPQFVRNMPKEEYVMSRLEEEGAAVLNNYKIREEILNNGGPDIGISCSIPPCVERYSRIYAQYKLDGDADKARKAIAVLRGPEDAPGGVCYYDYYGNHWDDLHGVPRQPKCPYTP